MIREIMQKDNLIRIMKADKDDLEDILKLQYKAYQSEAALFGGKKIPPLTFTSTRSSANIRMYQRMGCVVFDTKKIDEELEFVYMQKIVL